MSKWEYTETELWRHGENGIALFHVFGVIAVKNMVLALSEAREGNGSDARCPHSIWMRRSIDGGKNFEPTVCLIPAGGVRCLTNAAAVYDREIHRIFVFYAENFQNCATKNFLIYSDDMGVSWSEEESVNDMLETGENPMPLHLTGPGHGIQIKQGEFAGRLLMPFWHRRYGVDVPTEKREYCVSALYSDDHGKSWKHTDYVNKKCMANESRIVETRSGLLWVLRAGYGNPCRFSSFSRDGGVTWSEEVPMAMSPADNCDAGAVEIWTEKKGYEDMVLVSRISEKERRWNMEILISYDGGVTFPDSMKLPEGDAMPGYSDLCVIEEEEPVVGLLHCRSDHVLFSRISLQALTAGKYENTKRSVWLD